MSHIRIRFDVPNHYMNVNAFIASAQSTQRTLDALNAELFDGQLDLELVVCAPESGSVRQVLRVVVKGAKFIGVSAIGIYGTFWSAVELLETDIAKDVIKELTGKAPAQIAVEFAREYKERSEHANGAAEQQELEKKAVEIACQHVATVLSEASSSILAAPREKLEQLEISESAKFAFTDAQAELFEKCIDDTSIASIDFEEKDLPPIPRNEFPQRALRPRRPTEEKEDEDEWVVSLDTFLVTSPNLEELDQHIRKWKGKNSADKIRLFTVEDKEFWNMLHRKEISFSENTELVVQVASRFLDGRVKETKVLRVLKFEGMEIAQPIDENGLRAILGELKPYGKNDGFGHLLH
ncbi:hypothetical protein SAMN04488118_102302 [Epibacterium ulvae]|uniref:Uncharacterized protein n=1 Tax=Epibacterium ulvae TaxID=1156985 RepID=A0A1G5PZ55_9RHOB|nr:hypothetical protein [Epibacterium ulvae]SCZ54510.1 hypothetical protein SAMN04488118_102302 [Epibacterium ulvae]